jgi:hypothetical protein
MGPAILAWPNSYPVSHAAWPAMLSYGRRGHGNCGLTESPRLVSRRRSSPVVAAQLQVTVTKASARVQPLQRAIAAASHMSLRISDSSCFDVHLTPCVTFLRVSSSM